MGGDYALPILTGLFGGAGSGLYKGMEQGAQDNLAQQRIGLSQQNLDLQRETQRRMMDQFQQSQYTNVPGNMLAPDMRSGVDPATGTLRVQSHLVPAYLAANERDIARAEQQKKASALALAIKPLADAGDPYHKALYDALNSGADATSIAPIAEGIRARQETRQNQAYSRSLVAPFYKAMGWDMPPDPSAAAAPPMPQPTPGSASPVLSAPRITQIGNSDVATAPGPEGIPRTLPTPQQPGVLAQGQQLSGALAAQNRAAGALPGVTMPAPPTPQAQGFGGRYQPPSVTVDPTTGKLSFSLHPTPPMPQQFQFFEKMLIAQGYTPGTPAFDIKMGDLAKMVPVPAGGDVVPASRLVQGSAPPQPGAPPPSDIYSRPARPESPEVDRVTGLRVFAQNARAIADTLEKLLPDARARISFAARQFAQGTPYVQAFGSLSTEEQAIASQMGDLRLNFERAKGGVRLAASPQMNEKIGKIITDPASATAPAALRALADSADADLLDLNATLKAAGRAPINPQGGQAAPVPAATPPSQPQKPLPQRYKELRDSGMTKDQAGQQLKKEGYVLP